MEINFPDHIRASRGPRAALVSFLAIIAAPLQAADVTVSSSSPMLIFDDTDDKCCEWSIQTPNGLASDNTLFLFDSVGTNAHSVLSIYGEDGSLNNADSLVIDSLGDIEFGAGMLFDRSAARLSIGSLSNPALTLDLEEDTPGIRFTDTSDGSGAEIKLFNGSFSFRGKASAGAFQSFMTYDADDHAISIAAPLDQDLTIERGNPVLFLRDQSSTDAMSLRFAPPWLSVRNKTDASAFQVHESAEFRTLVVDELGRVGVNTASPSEALTVRGDEASVLVQENQASVAPRTLFKLRNPGNTKFEIENSDAANSWAFTNSGGDFRISLQSSGVVEFRVANNGDAFLEGALTQNSDVNAKQAIVPVDPAKVLEKVTALPLSQWQYIDAPGVEHIGPMAQDFHAAFGLGASDTGISTLDTSGVALAAIQALSSRTRTLDEENRQLRERNAALEARLGRLEVMVAGWLASRPAEAPVTGP